MPSEGKSFPKNDANGDYMNDKLQNKDVCAA
jgi:hypothetical protein